MSRSMSTSVSVNTGVKTPNGLNTVWRKNGKYFIMRNGHRVAVTPSGLPLPRSRSAFGRRRRFGRSRSRH